MSEPGHRARRQQTGFTAEIARSTRSSKLETRTARLRLPVAKKPVYVAIGPGISLGYRRNRTAGTWVARVADGKGGNWIKAIGNADDYDDADGNHVLDYWQAQEKVRTAGRVDRTGEPAPAKPLTVAEALDAYAGDLKTRGGDAGNVSRVRGHLRPALLGRPVTLLTAGELRRWRDGLAKELSGASVNRTIAGLKAALNLVGGQNAKITNHREWEVGLATIPDTEHSRNVILTDAVVRRIVAAACDQNRAFGLLAEVAAVTGARVSQISRIEVQDLQADRSAPRLMMPSSRKGRGKKAVQRRAVPIPAALAAKLRIAAGDRPATAPLLTNRAAIRGRSPITAGCSPEPLRWPGKTRSRSRCTRCCTRRSCARSGQTCRCASSPRATIRASR